MKKIATEIVSLLPDQKRKYLHLLLTEGEAAARAYLENMDCEKAIFIYKSEKELQAIKRRLEKCCPDETDGVRFFFAGQRQGLNFYLCFTSSIPRRGLEQGSVSNVWLVV